MKWMNGALLTGILAFLFFLTGGIRYMSLREQYLDRNWLDEELSSAAKDAVQDSLSHLEADTSLYPEPVWERFLLAYQAFSGLDRCEEAVFPAAVLTVQEGMYTYDREHGWSERISWEEDRIRQITAWLCSCVEADSRSHSKGIPYEIRFPYTNREEWARVPEENCLIVLYEGEGGKMADTGYYRLAIGGAQYRKRSLWYVQMASDHRFWYHQKDCPCLSVLSEREPYYTIEECAFRGALPCPVCIQ